MVQNSNQNATICSKRIQSQIRNLVGQFSVKCLSNGFFFFKAASQNGIFHLRNTRNAQSIAHEVGFDNRIESKKELAPSDHTSSNNSILDIQRCYTFCVLEVFDINYRFLSINKINFNFIDIVVVAVKRCIHTYTHVHDFLYRFMGQCARLSSNTVCVSTAPTTI